MNYRRKADRFIDEAHNNIASAEMRIEHSYTDQQKAIALTQLREARDFLRRAIATRDQWDATEHGDYDQYPDVPEVSR